MKNNLYIFWFYLFFSSSLPTPINAWKYFMMKWENKIMNNSWVDYSAVLNSFNLFDLTFTISWAKSGWSKDTFWFLPNKTWKSL